jgi:peptide/nickel transport system substrate-binding protein
MSRADLTAQRMADLRQAMRTHSIDRRAFIQVAGAAAVAAGLNRDVAAAAPLTRRPGLVRAQASANTFVYGSGQDISNLDPHTGHDYSITWGQRAVYDSLLRYQGNPPELRPLLATEVTGNPDATEWTIRLDERATFHDGAQGRRRGGQVQLRADAAEEPRRRLDVLDHHGRGVRPGRRPPDLRVTLREPFAPFDAILPWLFVANPAVVQANEVDGDEGEAWLQSHEAGGGPFTIAAWEIGSVYEFARFPTTGGPARARRRRSTASSGGSSASRRPSGSRWRPGRSPTATPSPGGHRGPAGRPPLRRQRRPLADPLRDQAQQPGRPDRRPQRPQGARPRLRLRGRDRGGFRPRHRHGGPLATALEPWHKTDLPVLRFDMDAARAALAASDFADGFELEYVYVTGLTAEENFGLIWLERLAELGSP